MATKRAEEELSTAELAEHIKSMSITFVFDLPFLAIQSHLRTMKIEATSHEVYLAFVLAASEGQLKLAPVEDQSNPCKFWRIEFVKPEPQGSLGFD